jgi:hypothetical protein
MYFAMVCERAGAYAASYNPVCRLKSKKSWSPCFGSMLNVQDSSFLGAREFSNDSRTTNHDGLLSFGIHPSKGDGFDWTQRERRTGETWILVVTGMTNAQETYLELLNLEH